VLDIFNIFLGVKKLMNKNTIVLGIVPSTPAEVFGVSRPRGFCCEGRPAAPQESCWYPWQNSGGSCQFAVALAPKRFGSEWYCASAQGDQRD